jgi:hypothetical protein
VLTAAERFLRRFRSDKAVVVVSGLPRSGTSMAMRMLEAGGLSVVTDGQRTADEDNPNGYYELECVKTLDKGGDTAWLDDARGKAVKIVSHLLTWLPENYDYRVIFMERSLDEIIASQNTMLERRGRGADRGGDTQTRETYERHLAQVRRFMMARRCFSTLPLSYSDVIAQPETAAQHIEAFLSRGLDVNAMARVADRALYRNRLAPAPDRR